MKNLSTLPLFFKSPHSLAASDPSEPILVALSGGADSVTLLHLVKKYSAQAGCKIYAAHINHGIRTEKYNNEADRDEQFCRDLCLELGVDLFVKRICVPELSQISGKSLETAARDERYSFFSEIMEQRGIKILCTAHNADDNLETVIFNLARGCGPDGICGIPEVREIGGGVAVRPILSAAKKDVLAYCGENSLRYVTDSTNLEDDCTRNRIRHIIIPELENIFGSPQRSARRLSLLAREEAELLDGNADDFLRMYSSENGDNKGTSCENEGSRRLYVELEAFGGLHTAMKRRVLCSAFQKYCKCALEFTHVDSLLKLTEGKVGVSALPSKKYAYISGKHLIFSDKPPEIPKREQISIVLDEGKTAFLPDGFAILLGEGDTDPPDGFELYAEALIKADDSSPRDEFSVRYRSEGDKILDGGVRKKLKKLMCDKKLPEDIRSILPLVCQGEEIIYVPKCAVADRVKAKRGERTLKIRVYISQKNNII